MTNIHRRRLLELGAGVAAATAASATSLSAHAARAGKASTGAAPASRLAPEIWKWSALEVAHHVRRRTISCREAVDSCLARVAAVNPRLNAIVHSDPDAVRRAADAADQALRRGAAVGPLHGVPCTVKINVDVKGEATTGGVAANKDKIATENSPVVDNLLRAGAVIIGSTNTPEFSFRWFTDNALHGRTLNPRNADLTPGGSSGGAASAVAAGMGPLAHGNDIAGSIRYPAYACGVVGLRPTAGRIPAYTGTTGGVRTLSGQAFSVQGPIARRVADVRAGLAAMSAGDPRDPTWIDAPLAGPAPKRLIRVALVDELDGCTIAPEVRDALANAAKWLATAGYEVERASVPHFQDVQATWMAITMNEVRLRMLPAVDALGSDDIKAAVHAMADNAPAVDFAGYMQAIARRDTLRREWSLFMAQRPVILMPVSCELPYRWGADVQGKEAMAKMLIAQSPMMTIAALSLPGLSVPTGLVQQGQSLTPVGVQIVAGSFREDLCLAAGEVIERNAKMPDAFAAG